MKSSRTLSLLVSIGALFEISSLPSYLISSMLAVLIEAPTACWTRLINTSVDPRSTRSTSRWMILMMFPPMHLPSEILATGSESESRLTTDICQWQDADLVPRSYSQPCFPGLYFQKVRLVAVQCFCRERLTDRRPSFADTSLLHITRPSASSEWPGAKMCAMLWSFEAVLLHLCP